MMNQPMENDSHTRMLNAVGFAAGGAMILSLLAINRRRF